MSRVLMGTLSTATVTKKDTKQARELQTKSTSKLLKISTSKAVSTWHKDKQVAASGHSKEKRMILWQSFELASKFKQHTAKE